MFLFWKIWIFVENHYEIIKSGLASAQFIRVLVPFICTTFIEMTFQVDFWEMMQRK